jgi:hypothetical protein
MLLTANMEKRPNTTTMNMQTRKAKTCSIGSPVEANSNSNYREIGLDEKWLIGIPSIIRSGKTIHRKVVRTWGEENIAWKIM